MNLQRRHYFITSYSPDFQTVLLNSSELKTLKTPNSVPFLRATKNVQFWTYVVVRYSESDCCRHLKIYFRNQWSSTRVENVLLAYIFSKFYFILFFDKESQLNFFPFTKCQKAVTLNFFLIENYTKLHFADSKCFFLLQKLPLLRSSRST